jgi:hypothetical protein
MTTETKTTTKTFRKGDAVHFIKGDLNGGLSATVRRMTVFSCGAKRMVLVDENGNKFAERELSPTEFQWEAGYGSGRAGALVLLGATDEQATASAMQVAENCRIAKIESCNRALSRCEGDGNFERLMRDDIATLETQKTYVNWR